MITMSEQNGCCSTLQPGQAVHHKDNSPTITTINIIINCFLVNIAVIIGSFGNIITIFILSRSKVKDTSSILLISMAVWDLLFLVNLFVCKLDCIIFRYDPVLAQMYYPYIFGYVRRPGRMAAFISFTHVVVISFERLLAVFYPFQVSHWITEATILTILTCVYFFWIVSFLPYTVANYEIEWALTNNYTLMLPALRETQWFVQNKPIFTVISEIINGVIGSLSAVVAANCCAITYQLHYALRHRSSITSKSSAGNRREVKISRMLLVVCVVFSFCNLPGFSIYIYFFADPDMKPPNQLFVLLNNVEELMLAVNAAANFFVYILLSEKFYKSVVSLFVCQRFATSIK
ncbi:unnamed protein product [Candidula unifasciata]|uniref:G-protein coupled receptors family 1 profile domain-containing protein n=1 Tax=Candidula unifasciata TaxID=100452 RepID=A0A8S3Z370_9EUPU|nr:unnamed protein product [Candidula unifasciata]